MRHFDCRLTSGGKSRVVATRGPGQFIGEVTHYKRGWKPATWQTSIQAKGPLTIWLVSYPAIAKMIEKHSSEVDADMRASESSTLLILKISEMQSKC